MKAVRFRTGSGETHVGRLDGETIVEAGPADPGGFIPSEAAWKRIAGATGAAHDLAGVRLLHPVDPAKLVGIGLNYRDHAEESELAIPEVPVVFAMWPSALVGPGEPIVVPRDETRPDYEGEVALVLGRTIKNASWEEARAAIGGISAFNDVSGRRAQLETPLRQFTLGKSFDTFAPMGPCVASLDDLDLGALGVKTTVSGELLQNSSTRNLIFPAEEVVEYCSRGLTLEAGTVIATGTPGGVGDSREPKRYLRGGDVVEVWVEGVGTLTNPVTLEA
ncbi:MAG: fumarylacetoacetate hydrolase family protein [Actinobacteria bacterium]|nr:fumarylacetoacetate hydrolase family protein [Actinomycetota bacterium]